MELTVTQENLTKALSGVGRVASNKAGLPILSNVLLRTDGNRLLIAATNLEIASSYLIGAKIVTPGAITIPARLASEFIASLPKGPVSLKVDGNHLTISSGKYKSMINGVIADEFPELPTIDESSSVQYSINTAEFKQSVSQTIITASSDSTRPVLTGIYWHSFEGSIYLVATDGYRLAERRLVATTSDVAAIIPATTMQEVLRTLADDISEVEVLFDETQVRFRVGDAEITSRLIDGNYPDYRQLIPGSSEINITINASDFGRIVKVAGLFARDSGGSITLTADGDTGELSVHSIASELGENTSSASAEISGSGHVTLNSRYLAEALGAISGSTVQFSFSGKLSACILTAVDKDANYKHVIMPLKS